MSSDVRGAGRRGHLRPLAASLALAGALVGVVLAAWDQRPAGASSPVAPGPLDGLVAGETVAWGLDPSGPDGSRVVLIDLEAGTAGSAVPGAPRPDPTSALHAMLERDGRYVTAQGRSLEVFAPAAGEPTPIVRVARVDLPLDVGCGPSDPVAGLTQTPDGSLALVTGRGGVAVVPAGALADGAVRHVDLPDTDCAGPERVSGVAADSAGRLLVATDGRVARVDPAGDTLQVAWVVTRAASAPAAAGPQPIGDGLVALGTSTGIEVWRTDANPAQPAEATACTVDTGAVVTDLSPVDATSALGVTADGRGLLRVGSGCSIEWSLELSTPTARPAVASSAVAVTQPAGNGTRAATLDPATGAVLAVSDPIPGCDADPDCPVTLGLTPDGRLLTSGPAGSGVTALVPAADVPAAGDGASDTPPASDQPDAESEAPSDPAAGGTPGAASPTPDGGAGAATPTLPGSVPGSGITSGFPGLPPTIGTVVIPTLPSGGGGTTSRPSSPPTPGRGSRTVQSPTTGLSLSDLLRNSVSPSFLADFRTDADATGAPAASTASPSAPGSAPAETADTVPDDPYAEAFATPPAANTERGGGADSGSLEVEEAALSAESTSSGSDAGALVVLLVVGIAMVLVVVVANRSADHRRATHLG